MIIGRFHRIFAAAQLAAAFAPGLDVVYNLELATQGIAFPADGHKFLMQRYSLTDPPRAVELLSDNSTILYPDAPWKSYNSSDSDSDPAETFASLYGARIGPDRRYWLIYGGSSGLNGATKLIGINFSNDTVDKLYYLDDIKASNSGIDDVRFGTSGNIAYLSDTAGALLVLNMTTGAGVHVLVNDPTAVAWFPMMYNHTLVPGYGSAGSTLSVGFDQLEMKAAFVDGSLTNATLASTLGEYAEAVALTPSTGGSAIDGDGNLYFSDTNLLAIWKVTPEGYASILLPHGPSMYTRPLLTLTKQSIAVLTKPRCNLTFRAFSTSPRSHAAYNMPQAPAIQKIEALPADEAKWVEFQKITWHDQTGRERVWEAANRKTRGAAGVDAVAITTVIRHPKRKPSTIIILQYRPPVDAVCVELPAGLVDAKETPSDASVRELHEETGYKGKLTFISPTIVSDPGLSSANMQLATVEVNLKEGDTEPEQALDDGEFIERVVVPLDELYERLVQYDKEGKTVDARLWHWAAGMQFAKTML